MQGSERWAAGRPEEDLPCAERQPAGQGAFLQMEKRKNSLSASVAQQIGDMIIQQRLGAGTRLPSETQLAEMYNVSRPTIREAMKSLKAQNVIVIRQGDGTYVNDNTCVGEDPLRLRYVDPKRLTEGVFEARLLLEPQIVMLAAQRIQQSELRQMEQIVARMWQVKYQDPARLGLDIEFHTLIAKSTHNSVFNQMMPVIYETIEKGSVWLHEVEENYKRSQRAHQEIYMALARRDAYLAKNMMTAHIYAAIDDIKLLDSMRDDPKPDNKERNA